MAEPLLCLRGVTKAFGTLVANDHIDLDVYPGRVHAIVGENGAGKTTLMSMINGTGFPDSGTIIVDGKPVVIKTPQVAQSLGIGMVFQHFKLVGSLTVAANVFLGRELHKGLLLDTEAMTKRVTELSEKFGLDVDPTAITRELSVGEEQRVEVLKALSHDTRILILDEPTAVLTPSETDDLFVVIRGLAKAGVAVIFISHKLDEVTAIADDLTVIRDGRVIASLPAHGQTTASIARMMVGRDVLLRVDRDEATPGDVVLAAKDLKKRDPRGAVALDGLSLEVHAGEIVGVAGVDGNGQSELVAVLAGMMAPDSGVVDLLGEDVTRATVRHRRELGMSYIPEDRHLVGTAPDLTIKENLAATHLTPPVARSGWISDAELDGFGQRLIDEFDIRGAKPDGTVGSLSGGNMQKVVIAREFTSDPKVLVVSQPTRGVDIGATEFVHQSLVQARDRGAGLLVVSADLNEVMSLADRLLVMHRGHIVTEFARDHFNETAIGLAMAGIVPDEKTLADAEAERLAKQAHVAEQHRLAALAAQGADGDGAAAPAQEATAAGAAPPGKAATGAAPAAASVAAKAGTAGVVAATAATTAEEPNADTSEAEVAAGNRTIIDQGILGGRLTSALQPIMIVVAALLIGLIIIAAIGRNPFSAYYQLFISPFTTAPGVAGLTSQLVPLLVLSAGVIVSFKAGFFNCGGEGQMFVGSLAGALTAIYLGQAGLTGPVLIVAALVGGFVMGGLWGMVPGSLYAAWRVNIVVTTLMMNSIAILLTGYLVTGPFADRAIGTVASKPVPTSARLPVFLAQYSVGLDLVIAIVVAIIMGIILTKSVWGLRVRELGQGNRFAEYTGVSSAKMSIQVMVVAGAVSGLAGAIIVLGPVQAGRFLQQFSPGYGFLAMTVALLARLNPWTAIVAAVFYADMMAGSSAMQANANVPYSLVNVIQGLLILMLTGTFAFNWLRRRRTAKLLEASDPQAVKEVAR